MTLAHAINALFYMFLKTQGVTPEEHPVTEELRRLELYLKKVDEAEAKLHGSSVRPTSVDVEAAGRLLAEVLPNKGEEKGTAADSPKDQQMSKKKRRKSKEASRRDKTQKQTAFSGQVEHHNPSSTKKHKKAGSKKEPN